MQEKKQESFTVTDRRLFTTDGEVRSQVSEETVATARPPAPAAEAPRLVPDSPSTLSGIDSELEPEMPPPPTAAEQQEQVEAYQRSSRELDKQIESGGHSAKDLEMTFERFMASLYMSAMLQLGLMQEEGGQPRVDLVGARQTIDTLSLLSDKTKGNLTPVEQGFLQNCLYELRMAYVEVTNALARPPQAPRPGVGSKRG